ncbi:MAG: hypothetical protein OXF84_09310 [Bacteroidetes bacterium]|nr:hypothetical protein [Bacteroidota bacterium]
MVENQTKPDSTDSPSPDRMESMVDQYIRLHEGKTEIPKDQYESLVNHYYDLSTDFYEFGRCTSFHFAPCVKGESFQESLLRHQRFLMEKYYSSLAFIPLIWDVELVAPREFSTVVWYPYHRSQ